MTVLFQVWHWSWDTVTTRNTLPFLLNIVANIRNITNRQDTKYTNVPMLEKMIMCCIKTLRGASAIVTMKTVLFSTKHPHQRARERRLHWSFWHFTDSVGWYATVDDGKCWLFPGLIWLICANSWLGWWPSKTQSYKTHKLQLFFLHVCLILSFCPATQHKRHFSHDFYRVFVFFWQPWQYIYISLKNIQFHSQEACLVIV